MAEDRTFMSSMVATVLYSTSKISLRQTWAICWSILPFIWPVMYSDLDNLSYLTPVILGSGKINAAFFKRLDPNRTISRRRLRGFRGLLISQRSQPHSLQGRGDWSYRHGPGEGRRTQADRQRWTNHTQLLRLKRRISFECRASCVIRPNHWHSHTAYSLWRSFCLWPLLPSSGEMRADDGR